MAATKAQINWTVVSSTATNITRVTNASVGQGGNLIKFKGDTDLYPDHHRQRRQRAARLDHDGRRRDDDGLHPGHRRRR